MGEAHNNAVQSVREFIGLVHGHAFVLHQGTRLHGSAGISDICFVARDAAGEWRFAWLEVKVGRDKLSPAQVAFRAVMELAGIPVIVGTAGDAAEFLGYA